MNDVRAVLDTNVVVSAALLPDSVPRQALDQVLEHGKVLMSSAMVREAELVDATAALTDCRDPKDNEFLELAVSGRATHIVTGDDDLLVLHPFLGIAILTPQDFLARVI